MFIGFSLLVVGILIEILAAKYGKLFNDNDVVFGPKISADVTLKNIGFLNNLYDVDVYDGKY